MPQMYADATPAVLIIDDEPNIRFSVEQVLADEPVRVIGAADADEGLRLAAEEAPAVVLLDIRLGKRSGLDLFTELRRLDPQCPIIFITGHGNADTTIEAMQLGAFDYLTKPLDADQLQQVVGQALEISRLMHVPAIIEQGDRPEDRPDLLVGRGPKMHLIYKQLGRVAPLPVSVLILGESGAGKELVARAIYYHSRRRQGPFLAINCAAIPEALLESELFGHERGAFTGAVRRRIGKFEQCHGGTLFLDEVGDMPLNTQAKILRVLQEGRFERIGGNETIAADVRILAATNQDLETFIEQGRFRKDLYYRLRGVTIHVPPLRERPEDIPELAHYYLFRYNRQSGTMVQSISPEALTVLQQYHWPGNVRELQSVIHEALIKVTGPAILPEDLPAELFRRAPAPERQSAAPEPGWAAFMQWVADALRQGETDLYRRCLEHFDRWLLEQALRHADGNQARAAELLGLSRVTLRAKLRSLGIGIEKVLTSRDEPKAPDS